MDGGAFVGGVLLVGGSLKVAAGGCFGGGGLPLW